MSCIVRVLVKVVALPVKLAARGLAKLGIATARTGKKVGKGCGKCGTKACKKCRRKSARICKKSRKYSQKACVKLASSTKVLCKRCGGNYPKRCIALCWCSHMPAWKNCNRLCAKCPIKHSDKPKCFRHVCTTSQNSLNHKTHRRGRHSPKLRGRRSRQKFAGINNCKRKVANRVELEVPSSNAKAHDGSKPCQGRTHRGRHTSAHAKRLQPSSNTIVPAYGENVGDSGYCGEKTGKHPTAATSRSQEESQSGKGKAGSGASSSAHTAGSHVDKKALSASPEKHNRGVQQQSHSKVGHKSRKPKVGSPAVHSAEVHETRENSHATKKIETDMAHTPSIRVQLNTDTNPSPENNKVQELKHSNEDGAQLSEFNSSQGVARVDHRNATQREQSKRKHEKKARTSVEEDAPVEAHLLHNQATLQRRNVGGKASGHEKENEEKVNRVGRKERSVKHKHPTNPAQVKKVEETVESSTTDGNLSGQTARRHKERKPDGVKPVCMMENLGSVEPSAGEAMEENWKNKNQKHNPNKSKSTAAGYPEDARRHDVRENFKRHPRGGNTSTNRSSRTDMALQKGDSALPSTSQTKLPTASYPVQLSDAQTIENKPMLSERQRAADIRSAEQHFTPPCQSCDDHNFDEEELVDRTTLLGIECRVLPEAACSAMPSKLA